MQNPQDNQTPTTLSKPPQQSAKSPLKITPADEVKITRALTFKSDFGEVSYDVYEPIFASAPNTPLYLAQIAHGMVEHKGRYEWLAKELAKKGFIVAISDHRGHGNSVNGDDITLGSMGEDGFQKSAYDLYKLTCLLKEQYKPTKVMFLGHSMGSLLARRYLMLYGDSLDALILSGSPSASEEQKELKWGIWLAKVFCFFNAGQFGGKMLSKIMFGGFNKKFAKQGDKTGLGWLCSEENIVQQYRADEKCQFHFDAKSFLYLFLGMQEVYGAYPYPQKPNLPILFISGSDDASGEFGLGVQRARQQLKTQGFEDVEIILYKGARHEVLNEAIKPTVLDDIILWLSVKGF